MEIPLDEVTFFDVIISTPATGAAVDADSTPTFAVYEESTDTDIGVGGNLTKRTSLTGNYRGTFTLSAANGFEVGKWYSIVATAIVGGVTGKCVVRTFRVKLTETVVGAVQSVVPNTQKVDVETIKTQAVTCAAPVTVLASVGTAATSTAQTGDNFAIVNSETFGNSALKTLIDTVDNLIDNEIGTLIALLDTEITSILTAVETDIPSDIAALGGGAVVIPAGHLGDINTGGTSIYGFFHTRDADGPVTAVNLAATAYRNNETADITSDVDITIDFDGIVGLNLVRLSTQNDLTSYATVSEFTIVLSGGTVNGISVAGVNIASFSIRNRASLYPTTAGETLFIVGGTARANLREILTTLLTEGAAGRLAASFIKFLNVAAPTATCLSLPDAIPGAANGLLISGSNAGTTTFGAFTVTGVTTHTGATVFTGNVSMPAGLNITQSVSDTSALVITGNGTGNGILTTGGSGGSSAGIRATSGASSSGFGIIAVGSGTVGIGIRTSGLGSGAGIQALGGTTGPALRLTGGNTTGEGIIITVAAGQLSISAGDVTWGAVIFSSFTTNITGNLSGSVGSVVGAVGSVTGAVGSVTGNVGGNVVGTVASVVGAVGSVTGNVGGNVTGSVGSIVGLTIANLENTATRFLTMVESDGAVYRYTINALEQGPAGGGGGSGATAQQVWEYASRTLTAFSFSAIVSITSPVADDGTISVVRGDDYDESDSRSIEFTSTSWPVLTGASVAISVYRLGAEGVELTKALTIVTATGTMEVRLELTAAETEALDGSYRFNLTATLASGNIVTLVQGDFKAVERRGA